MTNQRAKPAKMLVIGERDPTHPSWINPDYVAWLEEENERLRQYYPPEPEQYGKSQTLHEAFHGPGLAADCSRCEPTPAASNSNPMR